MSLCLSGQIIIFLLCFFGVHSNNQIRAESFPSVLGFELPQIDGSPVVDTCRVFETESNTSPTSTTKPTTRPLTGKQVALITRKPVVQSPRRKSAAIVPIRTGPIAGGPITNPNTNQALRLLYYLLANSRGRFIGSQPKRGINVMSSSEEYVRVWKMGAATSVDSSDES